MLYSRLLKVWRTKRSSSALSSWSFGRTAKASCFFSPGSSGKGGDHVRPPHPLGLEDVRVGHGEVHLARGDLGDELLGLLVGAGQLDGEGSTLRAEPLQGGQVARAGTHPDPASS